MELFIIILILIAVFTVWYLYDMAETDKERKEIIERRKEFVASTSPTASIIVNNGIYLFYIDNERGCFGVDETGKTYDLEKIRSIGIYTNSICIFCETTYIDIGVEPCESAKEAPLDCVSAFSIADAVLPVLRNNIQNKLMAHGIKPDIEYEHEGTVMGCDLKEKVFYVTCGVVCLYNFSDLRDVKEIDLSNNALRVDNYVITIVIESESDFYYENEFYFSSGDNEIDFSFYSKDEKYYDLLTMFKEIKKRGN